MLENGHVIGGEQSGHVILLEHNTTGDGLVTALTMTDVVKHTGKKLSELARVVKVLPQVLVNAKIKNEYKATYMEDSVVAEEINKVTEMFKDNGRILIRPSGTEPLVRVMIEGEDIDEITKCAQRVAKLLEERLG
jgi:phosphoglucosamine mutase